jgi:hypothetical protein
VCGQWKPEWTLHSLWRLRCPYPAPKHRLILASSSTSLHFLSTEYSWGPLSFLLTESLPHAVFSGKCEFLRYSATVPAAPMAVYNLLLGLSAFISIARAAETCYWPNGKATPSNWVPCPNSKVCCAVGEACLSNNLCYGSKLNIAYRGACTDISWPIADCPRICYEGTIQSQHWGRHAHRK